MIVQGDLKPGTQIVQEALAERLGLSRTPLRKAIATLTQENFLVTDSRGAAFVRSFNDDELTIIWEIRAVLEGLVCRIAAERIEPQHLAYLESLIMSAAEKVTPQDWTAYRKADVHFHNYLTEVVDDPHLTKILDSFQILSLTLASGLLRPPEETLPEHLEIINALREQDADRAERAMVSHIRRSIQHVRAFRDEFNGSLPVSFSTEYVDMVNALSDELQQTVLIAYLDGEAAAIVHCKQGQRTLRVAIDSEQRLPLHATAAGKVLLAWKEQEDLNRFLGASDLKQFTPKTVTDAKALRRTLADVREKGYAVDDEEYELGVMSIAAPLWRQGRVIAALAVFASTAQVNAKTYPAIAARVVAQTEVSPET